MSIFNELLPKIKEISNSFIKNFNDDLKVALDNIDKFEEEYLNGNGKVRDKALKEKNPMSTLQSIHEDEDETTKSNPSTERRSNSKSVTESTGKYSVESNPDQPRRHSKKRNKNEVDDIFSPEQDKRLKRNAYMKAQSVISKQVNVNLNQKMRRESSTEKVDKTQSSRNRRRKDEQEKENNEPVISIKQEKISLPPEPMDLECLPLDVPVKQEPLTDRAAMPPPAVPLPKPRKAAPKEKAKEDESSEEEDGRRRTRTRKQTDTAAPAPASARSTRSTRSSRASSRAAPHTDVQEPALAEARPKRTRAKKKQNEPVNDEIEKDSQPSILSGVESSAEKPRPKRTRKLQKPVEKEDAKPEEKQTEPIFSPKEKSVSEPEIKSPILPPEDKKNQVKDKQKLEKQKSDLEKKQKEVKKEIEVEVSVVDAVENDKQVMNETQIVEKSDPVIPTVEMNKTIAIPNGVYNTAAQKTLNMNETVVLEARSQHHLMDATVVLGKVSDGKAANLTDDNSLVTDDESPPPSPHTPRTPPPHAAHPAHHTPAHPAHAPAQPTSAVKEKVQQFEELASRVTRTKTRAKANKEESAENQTPPDKIVKAVLSADTLHKMNSLIFNGKSTQACGSAWKARSTAGSASKPTAHAHDKEDARKKKEAMLEAKREQQRKKREEKMAAAAAAREQAERERRAAHSAAARERDQRQAQLDSGRRDRLRDIERKKQELARKVAETEERRRAEELARQQRLAEEQKRAEAARRKQLEEAEAIKKEAAQMAKEIEKRQKEYMEKQKMKHRIEDKMLTPLKTPGTPAGVYQMDPVYMCDGFQYLNSDEEPETPVDRPVPAWSNSKARRAQLAVQCLVSAALVDRLFSVRVHSPDLRAIFPDIERARLKRTSSAVWRTPPARLPALRE